MLAPIVRAGDAASLERCLRVTRVSGVMIFRVSLLGSENVHGVWTLYIRVMMIRCVLENFNRSSPKSAGLALRWMLGYGFG